MRVLQSLALATVAAATLGLTTAVPAHADTQTKNDPRGDVSELEGGGTSTAADRRRTDVLSLKGEHGDGRLRFTFTMADTSQQASGGSFLSAQARFVTPSGADYVVSLERVSGGSSTTTLRRGDEQVTCRGVSGRVVDPKDRYVLTVPRSCVGNPGSVRFGGLVAYVGGSSGVIADDARRDGETGDRPRLGTARLVND